MCQRFFGIHIVFVKKEPVFIEFKIFENRFFYYETSCGAKRTIRPAIFVSVFALRSGESVGQV